MNGNKVTHFNSFGVEYVAEEIKKFIGSKNIQTNIYRIQACDSVMWGYFCNGFIDLFYIIKGCQILLIFFFPNNFTHFISNFISFHLNKSKLKFILSAKVKQDLCGSCVSVHEYKGILHEHGKVNISLMARHYKILVDYGHKKLTMEKKIMQ